MKWFVANLLSLNLEETYCMEIHSKYINHHEIQIKHNKKTIVITSELKFLGLILHNIMCWKGHSDMMTSILNKACYMVRVIRPSLSLDSLKVIYHAYFHLVIAYGLIFLGTSTHSSNIFKLLKCIVRILMGSRHRDSCREFLKL
jgi:hypothetical protein